MQLSNNTICAISTPAGIGGIAVIRISGNEAIEITDKLFQGKRRIKDAKGGQVLFGDFAGIDQVLVSVFLAPHSFTGEDTTEISCHGSLYIQNDIINTLLENGCRLARAGEFTQRAFLNGKMDLTEAEAVADLIASENKAAHELAMSHLRGGISKELEILRNRLLDFTSLIELELDFADHEELEFADRSQLKQLVQEIKTHIERLLRSFRQGNAIKNGVRVAIIGSTNAGKSTLLNALVGEERAIVSDIHGTTRDTIEDTAVIGDILYRFIDTAGIRQTDNKIEEIGIERSIQAAQKAQIILLVKDVTNKAQEVETELNEIDLSDKILITVYNKSDLISLADCNTQENTVYISAKQKEITALTDLLQLCYSQSKTNTGVTISNARHAEALRQSLEAIQRVEEGLNSNLSGEFLSMDLQDCLNALGEITGQITSQEVLNNVFKKFCIGK